MPFFKRWVNQKPSIKIVLKICQIFRNQFLQGVDVFGHPSWYAFYFQMWLESPTSSRGGWNLKRLYKSISEDWLAMYMATHENRCSTMLGNVTFIKARAPLYITGYGYTNSVILFPPCQKAYIPAYSVHTELHTAGALTKSFLSENAFAKVVLLLDRQGLMGHWRPYESFCGNLLSSRLRVFVEYSKTFAHRSPAEVPVNLPVKMMATLFNYQPSSRIHSSLGAGLQHRCQSLHCNPWVQQNPQSHVRSS